jgi:hypothetical protein
MMGCLRTWPVGGLPGEESCLYHQSPENFFPQREQGLAGDDEYRHPQERDGIPGTVTVEDSCEHTYGDGNAREEAGEDNPEEISGFPINNAAKFPDSFRVSCGESRYSAPFR